MNTETIQPGLIRSRQAVLRNSYLANPERALVSDYACTHSKYFPPSHPLHTTVSIDRHHGVEITGGLHTAVGGDSDAPTPGDILCGAVAACFDSTLRVIANSLRIPLKTLRVEVEGRVDVQGTLLMKPEVTVGFQHFEIRVMLEGSTPLTDDTTRRLVTSAERSCIVMQSLKGNPAITFSVTLVD